MSNLKDYQRGRDDGLDLALRIVKKDGIEALQDEVRFRGITGINSGLTQKELGVVADQLKELTFQTMRVAFIAVLHDTYGFGQTRIQRAMDAFDKLTAYLGNGWLCWADLIEEIKERLKLTIDTDLINQATLGRAYARPDPEDIYDERDLVDPELWTDTLKKLKFVEVRNDKGEWDIFDEHGDWMATYENDIQQVRLYDMLLGVYWGKNHDWNRKEPEPNPPVPKPVRNRRKKKR